MAPVIKVMTIRRNPITIPIALKATIILPMIEAVWMLLQSLQQGMFADLKRNQYSNSKYVVFRKFVYWYIEFTGLCTQKQKLNHYLIKIIEGSFVNKKDRKEDTSCANYYKKFFH